MSKLRLTALRSRALTEPVTVDQPAHLERFDRHLAVDALEIALEVGDLDAIQAALEQRAQRQYPAALLANRDDDLVDVEVAHRVFQRSAAREHAPGRHHVLVRLLERVETDEAQPKRIGRRQRRLNQPRLRSGAQHEHPMRQQMRHQRQDDGMAHEQQPEQRQHDGDDPVVVQDVDPRHPLRHQEGQRNADRRRQHDAQEIRACRKLLRPRVEPERAVEADDRDGKQQCEHRRISVGDDRMVIELQHQHDRGEQPRQLGAELEQGCARYVLSQETQQCCSVMKWFGIALAASSMPLPIANEPTPASCRGPANGNSGIFRKFRTT